MTADNIRDREELQEQIRALGELKMMAETYGFDISNPATNTQEAIQWMYFAYLAAVKEQNGAAMSIGRTSTFIDIYAERDLANGTFTEEQIREFVDHFIMKLRMVKFARTPRVPRPCSPATRSGSPSPSAAWVLTAVRSLPR